MTPSLDIPADYLAVLQPLFDALPLSKAMTQLVVSRGGPTDVVKIIVDHPLISAKPALIAGLWLYVDQLDASHIISQDLENPTGSFWHGIMHRREGDFSNSHYWFRKVGNHPAMKLMGDYNPHTLIDDVEKATKAAQSPQALIAMQQREWAGLFEWCAKA